ncbi:MAG: complex I NDUFA9 subunit family protein [Rhodospirillales bacterium]|nr:complex I NDUFA9 subunit family protein [Rhodospirillales bacterium]
MTITGRRVTVFGGSGFLGRYVVRRLAAQGWVVRVAVRDPVAAAFLKPMGDVGQIVPMKTSLIGDEAVIRAAVAGSEAVINLVGILYERRSQRFQAVHADGPARLARLAAELGVVHFVQVSAIAADPTSPAAYGRSKAAGESGVHRHFPKATIIRPSIVFGPEDGFFNRFAMMAKLLPALPLIGGGHTKFQPVYVCDVAEAIVRTLTDPAAAGKIYELGGPRVYSFRELMKLLLAATGRRRWLVSLPFWLATVKAAVIERLPMPPLLTRDQVELLKRDNVVSPGYLGLPDLGIQPTAVEAILPTYIDIFRKGGRFAAQRPV